MDVWVAEERVPLACLQIRWTARGFEEKSYNSDNHIIYFCEGKKKKKQTFLVFELEFLDEVVDETIVEIVPASFVACLSESLK